MSVLMESETMFFLSRSIPPADTEVLWRVSDTHYSESTLYCMDWYEIVGKTEKGVWIKLSPFGEERKFVLSGSKRRYAYPTKTEAVSSYQIRKRRQIMHLETGLDKAKRRFNRISAEIDAGVSI